MKNNSVQVVDNIPLSQSVRLAEVTEFEFEIEWRINNIIERN